MGRAEPQTRRVSRGSQRQVRFRQPLHRRWAEGLNGDVAFHKFEGRWCQENAAGTRKLLHARCEMSRLADGRVVHVEVTTDGSLS